MSSFGINPQASLMHPCSRELGQTLALGHGGGIVTYSFPNSSATKQANKNSEKVISGISYEHSN